MTFFDHAYEGTPTWDVGRPQGAIVRLAEAGLITGSVLDVGCGTGEHALYLTARGHAVTGVDLAAAAIEKAQAKAVARGLNPVFLVHDALDLGSLGRVFDCALDVGLFHCLEPDQRRPYVAGLRAVVRPGATCVVLCWSDRNPFGYGPTRISRRDLRASFAKGWVVEAIDQESLDTLMPHEYVHAWLARIRRI